jgi:hypothetical protein
MTRYTNSDLVSVTNQLDVEAKQAGLLPLDHKLVYNGGNQSNGISATVMVKGPDGNYVHGFDRFIPEFSYRTTRKQQYQLLEAALNVFYAMRIQREAAAKYFRA